MFNTLRQFNRVLLISFEIVAHEEKITHKFWICQLWDEESNQVILLAKDIQKNIYKNFVNIKVAFPLS